MKNFTKAIAKGGLDTANNFANKAIATAAHNLQRKAIERDLSQFRKEFDEIIDAVNKDETLTPEQKEALIRSIRKDLDLINNIAQRWDIVEAVSDTTI